MHPPLEMGKEREYFSRYWASVSKTGNMGPDASLTGAHLP